MKKLYALCIATIISNNFYGMENKYKYKALPPLQEGYVRIGDRQIDIRYKEDVLLGNIYIDYGNHTVQIRMPLVAEKRNWTSKIYPRAMNDQLAVLAELNDALLPVKD